MFLWGVRNLSGHSGTWGMGRYSESGSRVGPLGGTSFVFFGVSFFSQMSPVRNSACRSAILGMDRVSLRPSFAYVL